jgi:hypothetical protein
MGGPRDEELAEGSEYYPGQRSAEDAILAIQSADRGTTSPHSSPQEDLPDLQHDQATVAPRRVAAASPEPSALSHPAGAGPGLAEGLAAALEQLERMEELQQQLLRETLRVTRQAVAAMRVVLR